MIIGQVENLEHDEEFERQVRLAQQGIKVEPSGIEDDTGGLGTLNRNNSPGET